MPPRPQDRLDPQEIIDWRHSMRWSQAQAARATGVAVGTWRNWEQGQQSVGLPNLLRIVMRCLKEHRSEPDRSRIK